MPAYCLGVQFIFMLFTPFLVVKYMYIVCNGYEPIAGFPLILVSNKEINLVKQNWVKRVRISAGVAKGAM